MSQSKKVLSMIVGDGCVDAKGRITIHHSLTQKEWAESKMQTLKDEGFKVTAHQHSQMSYGQMREFIRLQTTVTTIGKELRELFYSTGKKTLPEIVATFGFEEWAIIYQDNGRENKINHYNSIVQGKRQRIDYEPYVNRYEISTNCFSQRDINYLQISLANLGVESKIMVNKKKSLILCISKAESKARFYEGISPYIVNCMNYKIASKPTLSYKSHTVRD